VEGLAVHAVDSLRSLVGHLQGLEAIPPFDLPLGLDGDTELSYEVDLQDIKGQEHAKRALEIDAAGAHHMLVAGPPGAGKTLLARAMPGILPDMTVEEALDVTRVYSVADMLPADTPLIRHRPFRAPHHTISHAGLVGGGRWPRPGEISLSHRGVLFLDELPEFNSRGLEAMRQPLEGQRQVTISRAQGTLTFPASFMFTEWPQLAHPVIHQDR
jgi:magnesium chelatase family protein